YTPLYSLFTLCRRRVMRPTPGAKNRAQRSADMAHVHAALQSIHAVQTKSDAAYAWSEEPRSA
ncbi:hypothetical protein V5H47_25540, partial [Salmonella enterica]|uniref:hypothetical protein n=1 Tax=Salmonella enterica TaxID=28901 RepID=UPI002FCD7B0E